MKKVNESVDVNRLKEQYSLINTDIQMGMKDIVLKSAYCGS